MKHICRALTDSPYVILRGSFEGIENLECSLEQLSEALDKLRLINQRVHLVGSLENLFQHDVPEGHRGEVRWL